MTNKIIIDLDNTLSFSEEKDYDNAKPNINLINQIELYKKNNFQIVIFTSRNMNTYNSNTNLIKKNTYPKIVKWLKKHNIFYDELIIGKPWCGVDGFYVDDRAIRPDEFVNLNPKEIDLLLKK